MPVRPAVIDRAFPAASAFSRPHVAWVVLAIGLLGLAPAVHGQRAVLPIAADDRVTVTVEGQPDLDGRYLVEPDGSFLFPLIGKVDAAGLRAGDLRAEFVRRLDAFIKDPIVQVAVERPQRVFVFGEVEQPGMFELTDGMTVLELLLQAQYSGVSEVLVVRTGNVRTPVLPEQAAPADVIRVNLRELESDLGRGNLSRNLPLETGDTVFVPPLDPNTVFVGGEVNSPGAYSVPDGTTVVQALTLAGWATSEGSLRRARLVRFEGGNRQEYRAKLEDEVRPGDTIVVPEAFFNPSFSVAPGSPALTVGTIRLGRSLAITPALPLTRVGVDSNVFNTSGERESDVVVEATPQLDIGLDLRRVRFEGSLFSGLQYYRRHESERAVNPGYQGAVEIDLARRVTLTAGQSFLSTRNRFDYELDLRVRREERELSAGVRLGPWGRLGFELSGADRRRTLPQDATFEGEALDRTLNQRVRSATAAMHLELTPTSTVSVSFTPARLAFPLLPARDANGEELSLETTFGEGALLEGRAHVSFLRYRTLDPGVQDHEGLGFGGELWQTWRERTEVGVRGERSIGSSFQSNVSFALVNRYGVWVRRALSRRFDLLLEVDHQQYTYRSFDLSEPQRAGLEGAPVGFRYGSQFGVLLGSSRVALDVAYEERSGSRAYENLRWGIVYGIFQAQN